jgi:RHS repeat-associated protein
LDRKAEIELNVALGSDGVVRQRQLVFASGPSFTDFFRLDEAGRVVTEALALPNQARLPTPRPELADADVDHILTDGAFEARRYELDGVANWTSLTTSSGRASPTLKPAVGLYQYDQFGGDSSGATAVAWSYDAAGNVASIGRDGYSFDVFGQLIKASLGGHIIEYRHDALGRRIYEHDSGDSSKRELVWDGVEVLALAPDGQPASAVLRIAGDHVNQTLALIASFGSGAATYLHSGPDRSVFAASSDTGLIEAYGYSAYGETTFLGSAGQPIPASAIANRFLFQGALYDPQLAAYHMRAREYRPGVGRFLSIDPLGVGGGENPYAFVLGRPLSYVDPFGESAIRNTQRDLLTTFPGLLGAYAFLSGWHVPSWTEWKQRFPSVMAGDITGALEGITGMHTPVRGDEDFERTRLDARIAFGFATMRFGAGAGFFAPAYATTSGTIVTSSVAEQAFAKALAANSARPNADLNLQMARDRTLSSSERAANLAQQLPAELKCRGVCDHFAGALRSALQKIGIGGQLIRVEAGWKSMVYSDRFKGLSGTSTASGVGYHEAIQVENRVFDNMRPQGVPVEEFYEDIGGLDFLRQTGAKITLTPF